MQPGVALLALGAALPVQEQADEPDLSLRVNRAVARGGT